jgi:hypothetical protein
MFIEHGQRPLLLVVQERTDRARADSSDAGLCRGPLSSKKSYRRRCQGELHDERELNSVLCCLLGACDLCCRTGACEILKKERTSGFRILIRWALRSR